MFLIARVAPPTNNSNNNNDNDNDDYDSDNDNDNDSDNDSDSDSVNDNDDDDDDDEGLDIASKSRKQKKSHLEVAIMWYSASPRVLLILRTSLQNYTKKSPIGTGRKSCIKEGTISMDCWSLYSCPSHKV